MAAGHNVDDVPTYDTVAGTPGIVDLEREFQEDALFCAAFTSSSGVRSFAKMYPNLDFSRVRAACIGEKTQATAAAFGMPTWISQDASMESLTELIVQRYQSEKA